MLVKWLKAVNGASSSPRTQNHTHRAQHWRQIRDGWSPSLNPAPPQSWAGTGGVPTHSFSTRPTTSARGGTFKGTPRNSDITILLPPLSEVLLFLLKLRNIMLTITLIMWYFFKLLLFRGSPNPSSFSASVHRFCARAGTSSVTETQRDTRENRHTA